jgi:tRNA modification GTPase
MMLPKETICAIATAPGGAIGIIRVSGVNAVAFTDMIFRPLHGGPLSGRKPYTLTFGSVLSETGEVLDEVLVSLFRAPHSYTGEDSTEIMCHGSHYILQQVMQRLVSVGCRMARPGEYTQRAFLNGKMDLSQAEAVADLISASSAATHRMAMNQMRGGFSQEISQLRDKLLHFTSLMELELDFSDHEELEFANRSELYKLAAEIEKVISRLADSFRLGNAIKHGVPVAIVGETNVGKSTILNALIREEKAIVSNIHGTTRDSIEDTFVLGGITYRFIDTAGIRKTDDAVEVLGIQRTFQKIDLAQVILWVIDGTRQTDYTQLKQQILPRCHGKYLIIVFNKCDKVTMPQSLWLEEAFADVNTVKVFVSASMGMNMSKLEDAVKKAATPPDLGESDVIVNNVRHVQALHQALKSIRRVQEGMHAGVPNDLVSQDLRDCIYALNEIVGEGISPEDTLKNIFKNFCIGK